MRVSSVLWFFCGCLLLYACRSNAADLSLRTRAGDNPWSEHWYFYLSALPAVIVMFATVPSFAFLLASNMASTKSQGDEQLKVSDAERQRQDRLRPAAQEANFSHLRRRVKKIIGPHKANSGISRAERCFAFDVRLCVRMLSLDFLHLSPRYCWIFHFMLFPAVIRYLKHGEHDINNDGNVVRYTEGYSPSLANASRNDDAHATC